jgi:transcriptional regulator with XRE-family HTH domain
MDIAENIARYRKAAGLSQEAAARLCGVALGTWSGWERGKINIPSNRLPEIARVLSVAPTKLVDCSENDA